MTLRASRTRTTKEAVLLSLGVQWLTAPLTARSACPSAAHDAQSFFRGILAYGRLSDSPDP